MSFTTRFAHLLGLAAAAVPLHGDVPILVPLAASKKYGEDDRDPERMEEESDEDYAKDPTRNRLSVLLSRTNHLAYHLGQIILVQR